MSRILVNMVSGNGSVPLLGSFVIDHWYPLKVYLCFLITFADFPFCSVIFRWLHNITQNCSFVGIVWNLAVLHLFQHLIVEVSLYDIFIHIITGLILGLRPTGETLCKVTPSLIGWRKPGISPVIIYWPLSGMMSSTNIENTAKSVEISSPI